MLIIDVIDTVQVFLVQPLEAALVWTNHKLSEAKHLFFVRTKSASNSCKRTLWKKKRVQVLTYTTITDKLF